MKQPLNFFRATLAGGILFLIPVIIVVIIMDRALVLADKIVKPLATHIPVESVVGLRTPRLLAIVLLLLFCFLTGIIAQTAFARKIVKWLESTVLSNLPGYEFFKSIGEGLLGKPETHQVVLVQTGDAWRIGFQLERLDNGLLAVFIPNAPNPHSGVVHLVPANKTTPVNASSSTAMKCLKRLGAGSNALFGSLPEFSEKLLTTKQSRT